MNPSSKWRRATLAVLVLLFAISAAGIWWGRSRPSSSAPVFGSKEFFAQALQLEKEEESEAAKKHWPGELLAEHYGAVMDQFWDAINHSTNKFETVKSLSFDLLRIPDYKNPVQMSHGIRLFEAGNNFQTISRATWIEQLANWQRSGWELIQCEFRHVAFQTNLHEAASTYYFSAHLLQKTNAARAILEGQLHLQWSRDDKPRIASIDASRVQMRSRKGEAPFKLVLDQEVAPMPGSYFIDPIIVRDLNGNHLPEIVLAAKNLVYHQTSPGNWETSVLCDDNPRIIFTGVIEDFDGDDIPDFLCARFDGLILYKGAGGGKFPSNGQLVWEAKPHLKYGQAISCGDLDGDGDLDVFLGQYKVPYDHGQMPLPYFDAKDGYPSYLLLNDGHGIFKPVPDAGGLGPKQFRRIYSASLVDWNRDGHLDLITVSDFAGLDAFKNNGMGQFADFTSEWFAESKGLGMAHSFADFNSDGQLDLMMIGMNSPVADRLHSLGETRPYDPDDTGMRPAITFGNRLLFRTKTNLATQSEISLKVARTGWSWGSAAADFNNDGYPDLYIANGHESKDLTRDYETEFWLHDIYIRPARENPLSLAYFQDKFKQTRGNGWSYGGYEKNRLFLNLGGTNFVEAGFLFGLALEADSRNVLAEDLNGDGKLDLIVTTFEAYPRVRQTIKIFMNELADTGNWVTLTGFEKSDYGKLWSIESLIRSAQAIVTGDSYRIQHSPTLHIGLGDGTSVKLRREPDGKTYSFDRGSINRFIHLDQTPHTQQAHD
jgi:hypothetical protein